MTLVYRSVFSSTDDAIFDSAEPLFLQWLQTKGYPLPPEGLTDGSHQLVEAPEQSVALLRATETLHDGSTLTRWHLEEITADQGRWITNSGLLLPPVKPERDAEVADDPAPGSHEMGPVSAPWIWVELEHEPPQGQTASRPGSPRFVRELLAAGEGTDGTVPLTAEPWVITSAHIAELARYILDPRRRVPILVFAADARRAYDQDRLASLLARDLAGVAAVFQLSDGEATQALAQRLPEGYAVYAGGLRTYLPGLRPAADGTLDDAGRHRTLGRASLAALGPRAFPGVKDQVLALSTRRALPKWGPTTDPGAAATATAADSPAVDVNDTAASRPVPRLRSAPLGAPWLQERLGKLLNLLGGTRTSVASTDTAQLARDFDAALDELLAAYPLATESDSSAPPAQKPDDAEAPRLAEQRELYDALLADAERERDNANGDLELARMELEDLQLDATETSAALETAERRARWLEKRLREMGDAALGEDDELPAAPPSVADALELAREHLTHVVIGDTDQTAAELDLHAASQMFAIKTWQALIALNDYAQARSRGEFQGSFMAWCQSPPGGRSAISANSVAPGESQTVDQSPALRSVRVFTVPTSVNESGEVYMAAHIRISKRAAPAPRLHFHDDSAKSGKVYVGYLGAHLPTARFG
ncbi:hypothetical protein GCM10027270_35400 [Nocardioides ginkgobilobae]